MKTGCIFCENGYTWLKNQCGYYYSIKNGDTYAIKCTGSLAEKKKCPVWAAAFAEEEMIKTTRRECNEHA